MFRADLPDRLRPLRRSVEVRSEQGWVMFCHTCGADAGSGAFCPRCGTRLFAEAGQAPSAPPPTPPVGPAQPPPAARPPSPRTSTVAALVGVAVGVVVMLVATLVFVLRDDNGSSGPEEGSLVAAPSESASASESASPSESPSAQRTKRPKSSDVKKDESKKGGASQGAVGSTEQGGTGGPGDVRTLPAGLFCRDLSAQGYSYSAAVDYWRMHGQTNDMDADRNGIPCETVYPSSDVQAYWGTYTVPTGSYPQGLYCRDLYARGASYADAVAYWFSEGAPDRMDADLNGIPCETVYSWSEVAAYWGVYQVPGIAYYEPGLFCRDLYNRGASYADAVAYWFSEGAPDRMDADRNGIPCETVYPASAIFDYWY